MSKYVNFGLGYVAFLYSILANNSELFMLEAIFFVLAAIFPTLTEKVNDK